MKVKLALIALAAILIIAAGCSEMGRMAPVNILSMVTVGEVNGVAGQYCTTLFAGQSIDAGTVCAEVIDYGDTEELCITYTTTGGWELVEAHLWVGEDLSDMPQTRKGNPKVGNFPHHSGDITGQTTYTFCLDLNQFGTEGGAVDLCDLLLYAAAHAVVRKDNGDGTYQTETGWGDGQRMIQRGNWATYFTIQLDCELGGGGGGGETGETAFAYDCDIYANCFLDIDEDGDGNGDFNRWGWSNGALGVGTYYFDIYAGAGQCDISKGTLVGLLTVDYDGSTATVTYNTCGTYYMDEVHLYVGNEILARDVNGDYTVAPGQYPYIDDDIATNEYTFTVDGLSGDIYVVAHAVVVGDYSQGDCGTRGCVPPCDPTEITTLYGRIGGYLVTVDPTTGDATEVAPFDFSGTSPEVGFVFDLAFDATTGILYGLGRFTAGNTPVLVEINPCTAQVALVGAVTVSGRTVYFGEGFTISSTGEAYVSLSLNGDVPGGDYYSETLARLDLGTAVAEVVGAIDPTVQHEADGLQFVGATLYAGDSNGNNETRIYTLDTSTGAATYRFTIPQSTAQNASADFAYNPVSGVFHGFDPGAYTAGNPAHLYSISDLGTGEVTVIGETHDRHSEFGGTADTPVRMSGLAWGGSGCCE
jgi:hypothetical protein